MTCHSGGRQGTAPVRHTDVTKSNSISIGISVRISMSISTTITITITINITDGHDRGRKSSCATYQRFAVSLPIDIHKHSVSCLYTNTVSAVCAHLLLQTRHIDIGDTNIGDSNIPLRKLRGWVIYPTTHVRLERQGHPGLS